MEVVQALFSENDSDRLSHFYLFLSEDALLTSLASHLFSVRILGGETNLTRFPREDEKLSVRTVDELVQDSIIAPQGGSRRKIYEIIGADSLEPIAQNKLLKTLEEPPKGVIIIFTAKSSSNLLAPIVSRSRIINFGQIPRDDIYFALSNESSVLVGDALDYSQGSLARVEQMLKDRSLQLLYKTTIEQFSNDFTSKGVLGIVSKIIQFVGLENELVYILILLYRDVLCFKLGERKNILLSKNLDNIEKMASFYSENAIYKILKFLQHAKERLQKYANTNSFFDELVFKIAQSLRS